MLQRAPIPHIMLIVNGLDIGGQHGGAERFALELAIAIQANGWKCSLGALARSDSQSELEWKQHLEDAGVRVVFLSSERGSGFFQSLQRLNRFSLQEQVAVVNSHCQIGSLLATFLKVGHPKIKVVRTIHAGSEWGKGFLPFILRHALSHIVFGLVMDAQVGVSRNICERLGRSIGVKLTGRQVVFIPNALPDEWYASTTQRINKITTAPVVGTVGVLNALKNFTTLIEAIEQLTSEFPGIELWIIGNGPERSRLAEQARQSGLEKQIVFWGQQSGIRDFLRQMDIFALPSLSEGLPTVILECMSQHVPVIASDIPGNRELVDDGETGWLFPAKDACKLATAIQYTLEHPDETQRVVQRAAHKVKRFALSTVAPQYLRLFQEKMKLS